MLHDEAFFLQNIWQYGKNTYLCTRDKQVRQWVKGGDSYVMGGPYLLLALRYERGNWLTYTGKNRTITINLHIKQRENGQNKIRHSWRRRRRSYRGSPNEEALRRSRDCPF